VDAANRARQRGPSEQFLNFQVRIGERTIGPGSPVFVIAEAGVNHFGQMERAIRLVDMAVEAKADAVKFQVYKTELMIAKESREWVERMKQKELRYEEIAEVKKYCERRGILFLASAHEEESVDFLNSLGVPVFKVGSGEKQNLPYLRHLAEKKKPILLSTGMYSLEDVRSAVRELEAGGCREIVLLHCVTLYPTRPNEVNLRAMDVLRSAFPYPVGYSDHTVGMHIVLAAVARGAVCIEKHIALEKEYPGTQDPIVSCDKEELIAMVRQIREIEDALGSASKAPVSRERESEGWARKSLVARVPIREGVTVTRDLLVAKRPGTGISPAYIDHLIGRVANRNIDKDEVLKEEWFSPIRSE